ncbi:hypothetical protein [Halobacillus ihumii]|uniref:hypothetical protein n=1 Tax=Halobacillus ihumii TaxID=2686092 RepID=UPI0013D33719|nr:hypothetical protein [Halobacillus ihumii]
MLLFLLALLLICGGWLWFSYNHKNEKSHLLLFIITIGAPYLNYYIGLQYAAYLGSQGAGYVTGFLTLVLFANSIIMIISIAVSTARKNRGNTDG